MVKKGKEYSVSLTMKNLMMNIATMSAILPVTFRENSVGVRMFLAEIWGLLERHPIFPTKGFKGGN